MRLNHLGRPRESVLDCIVLEPTEWLVGEHLVRRESDGWPVPTLVTLRLTPQIIPDVRSVEKYLEMKKAS